MDFNIAIIGLGLIGGSLAKAIKQLGIYKVYGFDIDEGVVKAALDEGAIDCKAEKSNIDKCDIIIIALYPHDTVAYVQKNISNFKRNCVIIDSAGTKENICDILSPICAGNGVYFIGGHPMAGKEVSGYHASEADLYKNASMILCRDIHTNIVALKRAELFFLSIGFGRVTITSAAEHDKVIAFTSQLAHVVSSAYIKSETAKKNIGFSAGSFKDLTRVAKLNEVMWTELFFENKENLLYEINGVISRLSEYKSALQEDNPERLKELLRAGRLAKEDSEQGCG